MKIFKRLLIFVIILALLAVSINFAIGYYLPKDPVQKDIEIIQTIVDTFEDQLIDAGIDKEMIDETIQKIEDYNNETKYLVKFNVVNNTNTILNVFIHLPVDENIYNSVSIGDIISAEMLQGYEEFANFIDGWTITVEDKIIRE